MSDQISAWFKELIKDQVTVQYQAHGGYLDGTMMSGDVQANTVKFPIIGRTEVYELTGAIEMVPTGNVGLTTVTLTMKDFEAAEWWRVQDAYKAGPSEQAGLATILTKAIRRKRDTIKLDALATFAAAGGDVTTIGDGTGRVDLLHFEQARAEIAGAAGDDDQIFAGIPAMWASQLAFYDEFGNARWVGEDNAPFSKKQRSKMRTVRDITYIELPDEYFTGPSGTALYSYVWAKSAMGAETPWNQESADLSQHKDRQGSPWLAKTAISGAAVGIQGKGVKRLNMLKITAPARPA